MRHTQNWEDGGAGERAKPNESMLTKNKKKKNLFSLHSDLYKILLKINIIQYDIESRTSASNFFYVLILCRTLLLFLSPPLSPSIQLSLVTQRSKTRIQKSHTLRFVWSFVFPIPNFPLPYIQLLIRPK